MSRAIGVAMTSAMPADRSVPTMYGSAPKTLATGSQVVPVMKSMIPKWPKASVLLRVSIPASRMRSPMTA